MSATHLQDVSALPRFFRDHSRDAVIAVTVPVAADAAPALISCAREAAADGVPVLLLGADGVQTTRLAALAGDAPGIIVLSVREAALAVIAGGADALPRGGRVLDSNEMDVLMEDMKVSGLKPGRLREMTKFFAKGIADGVSHDGDWLISDEERRLFALLTENLDARRALLPVEVCDKALAALATTGGAAAARGLVGEAGLVIAAGFGTLSATAQAFTEALAPARLIAVGCDVPVSNSEEDYPCFAGLAALAERADAAAVVEAAPIPTVAVDKAAHPVAEFDCVAALVQEAVAAGTEPGAITVACPHPIWMGAIADRLAEAGIAARVDAGPAKVEGDPRTAERCGRLRTRALARLLADPNDFCAWRSWLGLGDWLLRSDAFLELLAWARGHDMAPSEAFRVLAARPEKERGCRLFAKFDGPIRALADLRGALTGTTGKEAAKALEAAGCTLTGAQRAALTVLPAFDADAFAALVLDTEPDGGDKDAVAVVPYRRALGHHGALTVICGLVCGFLPALDAVSDRETVDHRRRALDRDRLLFEAVRSTAAEAVVLTAFSADRIENADILGVDARRIYMEDGLRYIETRPSPYLTDAGPVPAAPTVACRVSGMATC